MAAGSISTREVKPTTTERTTASASASEDVIAPSEAGGGLAGPAAPWTSLEVRPWVALQRKRSASAAPAGDSGGEAVGASRGDGLPAPVQSKMEGAFGADFSSVKIHRDSSSADALGAQAFTQGEQVHFAPGRFDPQSHSGQALIGHELSHVVQQREGRVQAPMQARGLPMQEDSSLERQADLEGERAASGMAARATASTAGPAGVGQSAPVQAKANVEVHLDWKSATAVKSLHSDPFKFVYAVSWGGDTVVAKLQNGGASFKEITMGKLAQSGGFQVGKNRLIAVAAEEGQECLEMLETKLERPKFAMEAKNFGANSIMVMEYQEGADISDSQELEQVFNGNDGKAYWNLGRLLAFQVLSAGKDRFALPGGNLNEGNIRVDTKSSEMQAIDTDIKDTIRTKVSKTFSFKKDEKTIELRQDPKLFLKAYMTEVGGHIRKLMTRKQGEVASIAAPMVEYLTKKYNTTNTDIERFQIGILEGLKDMSTHDFKLPTLLENVRSLASEELTRLDSDQEKVVQNIPETQRETFRQQLIADKLSIAHGNSLQVFIEGMQQELQKLFKKNAKAVNTQLNPKGKKEKGK